MPRTSSRGNEREQGAKIKKNWLRMEFGKGGMNDKLTEMKVCLKQPRLGEGRCGNRMKRHNNSDGLSFKSRTGAGNQRKPARLKKKKAWKWSAAKNRTSFHRDKTMLFLRGREAGEGTDGERGEGGMEKRAV